MSKNVFALMSLRRLVLACARRGFFNWIKDEAYLTLIYRVCFGEKLNLDNPQTFNEKLQWLKLNNRKSEYTKMVDKYMVRDYIKRTIGEEFLIPILGIWATPDDINFDELPDQFVLKCNHDSGSIIICKDKKNFNAEKSRRELKKHLRKSTYSLGREWPYKDVPRKIICESFMKDLSTAELRDYKFYCFNGEPKYVQVISDRTTHETIDFFDMNWIHQEFTGLAEPYKPFSTTPIIQPITFEQMKDACHVLSKDIPFLRVDFYEINGKMYFGELTFFPASGLGRFKPDEWNYKLGDMLQLQGRSTK